MKIIISILVILIVISITIAYNIDSQLYYQGKNDWEIHNKLPFKIKPKFWGYNYGNLGFVLLRDDETLIANGKKDSKTGFQINEIIKYGFNKDKLVVLVNDSSGNECYIKCIKNKLSQSEQDFQIIIIHKDDSLSSEQFKWINIKNFSTEKMELARSYLEIFVILIFFILIYIIKTKKKSLRPWLL